MMFHPLQKDIHNSTKVQKVSDVELIIIIVKVTLKKVSSLTSK